MSYTNWNRKRKMDKEMMVNAPSKIDNMIAALKTEFDKMERIDPCSEKVLKIRDVLKKLDKEYLQKIINADIKFLRIMAATEIRNREGK